MTTKKLYRFDPVGDHNGLPSHYHHHFVDDTDFMLNSDLIEQLQLDTCPETTPEGKALWVYLRLCQILRYDEGHFYREYRNHPNDDPYQSFEIVGDVTAKNYTTCYNFSRIAVKLMEQFAGVHALVIGAGANNGHFRFGYYTDKVAVDAEATSPQRHFNDMARVKLGINPQGLNVFDGQELMHELMQKVVPPMLAGAKQNLRDYIGWLRQVPATTQSVQVQLEPLVAALKKQGVDGASTVQLLFDINRQLVQWPCQFLRVGLRGRKNSIKPQLLVLEKKKLSRLDLHRMEIQDLPLQEYYDAFRYGDLVHADDDSDNYFRFCQGLRAAGGRPSEREF